MTKLGFFRSCHMAVVGKEFSRIGRRSDLIIKLVERGRQFSIDDRLGLLQPRAGGRVEAHEIQPLFQSRFG